MNKDQLLEMCKILGLNVKKSFTKDKLQTLMTEHQEIQKNNNIIASGKIIQTIYHTADIHIRPLERHTEYQQVFENLIVKLKEQNGLPNSVMIICGDIFHNRDRLHSETILLFNKFIEDLTKIIDVIMILGNHDTFVHNDRLDVISGITDIKTFDNFYFLKLSGVYKYHNLDIIVNSLLDNKFIRYEDIVSNTSCDNITVCLYHGAITSSKLDNGIKLQDDSSLFRVSDFKGYDYTLLGDIHLRQKLADNIAYSGSLVQQNFKEEKSHGILKWDLINKSCEYIEIHNDYSYITIDHCNINDVSFTKFSRIKLLHDYQEDLDIEEIIKQIKTKTTVLSITKEIKPQKVDSEIRITKQILEQDYFTQQISKEKSELKIQLQRLHQEHTSIYDKKDISPNLNWEIEEVEFMNVFIYGGNHVNKVKLNTNGIIGLLAENATGKSNLFNTIMYCLFGNSYMKSKNYSNRNIINKKANNFYIKMVIKQSDTTFIIHRYGKNKTRKNDIGIEEHITFKKIDSDGTTIDLTDTSKAETINVIHKVLSLTSKDLFLLTNVLSNVNYVSMLNMTSSSLAETFTKVFNVDKYKEIYKNIYDKCKELGNIIKSKETELKTIQKQTTEISNKQQNQEILKSQLTTKTSELNIVNEELECITNDLINLGNVKVYYEPKSYDKDILNELENENLYIILEDLNKEYTQLKSQIVKSVNTVSNSEYAKLKNKEVFVVSDFIIDLKEYNNTSRYNDTISIPKDLYDDILELFSELDSGEYLGRSHKIKMYEEQIITNNNNDEIQNKIKVISDDIYKTENKLNKLKQLIYFKEQNEMFEDNKEKIKIKCELENNRLIFYNKKKILQKNVSEFDGEYKYQELLNETINKNNEYIKNITNEITIIKSELNVLMIYRDIMNEKCLPKMILNSSIKKVSVDANMIIYQLIGLYVEFDTESDDKWEIYIKKNGMNLGVEHVSGFEKLVINIGLKIAMDKNQYGSSVKFFAIDESLDCTGTNNFYKLDEIFKVLQQNYNTVLIISHNDLLKSKINSRIIIESDYICSKIKQS